MAEQVSHHVVNGLESASASALADAAANQIHSFSAAYGPSSISNDSIANANQFDHSESITGTSIKHDGTFVTDSAAKPSAGDAATSAEQTTGIKDNISKPTVIDGIRDFPDHRGDVFGDEASIVSADHSVHSDTDTSRADTYEHVKDGIYHNRANSVKKPATFSKVSVTKTFMAKSASPAPPIAKVGEKPALATITTTPAARPRLVAKTGSALQNAQKVGLVPNGMTGPDASKVWNRNRPAPPPQPKQFTDEELKQQYGIHLATRLQTDESGKESKWADIDDDEDDWAPETVVWIDGTKSTVAPADVPAAKPELARQAPPPTAPPATSATEPVKPVQMAVKLTDSGPPKTILKPGIAALQAKQQNGSAGSSSNDKPALKAKNAAPAPVKSPWATIPAVDAVSPVTPPIQQQPPSMPPPTVLPSQDVRLQEPARSLPAREIAADTFDRSWNEGESSSRELFNSVNGRYEPAPDGRRSSIKPDRKPALLQRPSHQSTNAPAEISSAAPSRSSSSQMDVSATRRRGSSISHASGPGRRVSFSKNGQLHAAVEKQDSNSTQSSHVPETLGPAKIDSMRPTFPQKSPWDSQMPEKPTANADQEDPVKAQERIMREKRELAIKRRKEEEDRMEAERKERLKVKLDALSGAGTSKAERMAAASAVGVSQAESEGTSTAPATVAETVEKPTPAVADVVKPVVRPAPEEITPLPKATQPHVASLADRPISSTEQAQRSPASMGRPQRSPGTSTQVPLGQAQTQQPATYKPASSSYSSPGERKAQPFGRSTLTGNDAFSPWGVAPSNGNVWGSSGIGNGTFEKSSSFAPLPLQNSSLPPPPGMGRATSTRVSPQTTGQETRDPNPPQSQTTEPLRSFVPPPIDPLPENKWGQVRANGVASQTTMARQPHVPGPIAPPSRTQAQQLTNATSRADALAAWNRAAQTLPYQYAIQARNTDQKRADPTPEPANPSVIKETFRQTSRQQSVLGAPRRYEKVEYTLHDSQGSHQVASHAPPGTIAPSQSSGPLPAPLNHDIRVNDMANAARASSGAFPVHHGSIVQPAPIAPPTPQPPTLAPSPSNFNFRTGPLPSVGINHDDDVSPPPPAISSHQVKEGGLSRPKVKLPPPPPVVKLPPASILPSAPVQATVVMPPRTYQNWTSPGPSRPLALRDDWQARFNGLFNRTPIQTEVPPSPPKTPPKIQGPALAVASSTKSLLHESSAFATVSLPAARKFTNPGFPGSIDHDDVVSKPAIEPMFTEELSFGSLPRIHIPRYPIYAREVYEPTKVRVRAKTGAKPEEESQTCVEFDFFIPTQGYYLRVPDTHLANKLVRYREDDERAHQQGNRKPSSKFPKTHARDSKPTGAVKGTNVTTTTTTDSMTTPSGGITPLEKGRRKSGWARPNRGREPPAKTVAT